MLTRRSLALGGLLTSLGALLGGIAVPRREALPNAYSPVLSPDFLGLPEALRIEEEWIEMELRGKLTLVHRIHMDVLDGVDRTGGIAILYDIPVGCRVWNHPDGHPTMERQRRIILPLFEFDPVTNNVVGEEMYDADTGEVIRGGPQCTPEGRLEAVVVAAETAGFDIVHDVTKGRTIWITQDGPGFKYPKHAMAHVPYDVTLDDMAVIVPLRMVNATVIRNG